MQIFTINDNINENLKSILPGYIYNFLHDNHEHDYKILNEVDIIIQQIKNLQDQALLEYSNKFDNNNFLKSDDFLVSDIEFNTARNILSNKLKYSLDFAKKRIEDFHRKQLPQDLNYIDELGVELGNRWKSIERVGVYVPGGTASYPSSVLMSVIPAKVAGVEEVIICTPSKNNQINPAILYACEICEIKKVFKIGGAQAIASLAYGTQTIPKVDKIVGPGNAYVALAKKQLYGVVGIDMIAGPTDVTIVADANSNPKWLAIDALSQLEHGNDSKAFIIVDSYELAKKINIEIINLNENLLRKDIIEKSLKNSAIFVIKNLSQAHHLVNFIAPEHLQINIENYEELISNIKNAGAIFIGQYSPEAIGDYVAGPSHTLPTSGTSRFASGLSVYDFLKRQSLIKCNKNSFTKLSEYASLIAQSESLTAHQQSIDIRNI